MKNQIKQSLKHMFFKSMGYLFLGLTLFIGSCQEQKEDTYPEAVNTPLSRIDALIDQSSVPFRVEDNTLMFSSEENFQKAIDFLNTIGDENFDNWEQHYGFKSLRRSLDFEKVHQKTDNLFATLLNNNSEIIVESNRFKVDFENEKIFTTFADDIAEVSKRGEFSQNTVTAYNFTDDVFSLLDKGDETKATYCGGRDVESAFPFLGWLGDHIYLRLRY